MASSSTGNNSSNRMGVSFTVFFLFLFFFWFFLVFFLMISQICRFFVKIFIPTRLYFRSCAFWLENKTYSWNGLGRRNLMSRCFIEAVVSHGSNWLVPFETKQNSYIPSNFPLPVSSRPCVGRTGACVCGTLWT